MFVFLLGIKTGASTTGKITMSVDFCIGELCTKGGNKLNERLLLFRGACVLKFLHIGSTTADVTDADAVTVVRGAMCTDGLYRPALDYLAVKIDYIVIAYRAEASLLMPGCDVCNCVRATFGGVRAMYDDFIYRPHCSCSLTWCVNLLLCRRCRI